MSWFVAVLWGVLTGIAAGINPDWQKVYARDCGQGTTQNRTSEPGAQTRAAPTGTAPPKAADTTTNTAPGAQITVDVPQRENEFSAGLPYVKGPCTGQQRVEARDESEGRRRRRPKPAPSAAESLCARCKAAIEHDLTVTNHVEQAAAQEAEHEALVEVAAAAAPEPVETAPEPTEQPFEQAPASIDLAGTKEAREGAELRSAPPHKTIRRKFTDRLVTRLSTRGAMTRTLGSDEPIADAAGKLPSPTAVVAAKRS